MANMDILQTYMQRHLRAIQLKELAILKEIHSVMAEYGFILRYPEEKVQTTDFMYQPWHIRYVGEEAAKEIYEQGITLEEYLLGE